MTPTSFNFTVTMPGDSRLVGAVRLLAAQAGSYAQLSAEATETLSGHVEGAANAAIAASGDPEAPIECRFSGDHDSLTIVISCEARTAAAPPAATSADGLTVAWSADGSRHVCHIRQRTAA